MSKAGNGRRTRRSVGTIHVGHLMPRWTELAQGQGEEIAMHAFFEELRQREWETLGFTSGAFALERGNETDRVHIQFYIEHGQKTATTLSRQVGVAVPAVFYDTVRSAKGSWDYCTGRGKHAVKPAIARFSWGEPTLFGSTEADTSFRWCVDEILAGARPEDLLRQNAYAYAVHRQRIWTLFSDLAQLEKNGRIRTPESVR